MEHRKAKLIAIVGPTASGKTALSIEIARKYDGEIISADSRAIYKHLDIGSAKPSKREQGEIVHWGFDLVGPDASYSVADYKKYADSKIIDIQKRHKLPILVGGSGLYIDSVLYDYSFAPINPKTRAISLDKNIAELQQIIKDNNLPMPENQKNKRYLIRVIERGDAAIAKKSLPNSSIIVGMSPDKTDLHKKISKRLDFMLKEGVVDEIELCGKLYGWESIAMTGGIYKAFKGYIEGGLSLEEAKSKFIKSDQLLAKKQMTWFRRNKDIKWFINSDQALVWLDSQIGGKL